MLKRSIVEMFHMKWLEGKISDDVMSMIEECAKQNISVELFLEEVIEILL